ncbi:MAG: hypothetical protein ABFD98_07500 [Syntrophobacteraceae bacterium]|nr:hypothetical protein [Desulfobacteraceae bacterium]
MTGVANGKVGIRLSLISAAVLLALLLLIGLQFDGGESGPESLVRNLAMKQEVLSRMRINIIKSADVEKGAVMADSDEMSRALAGQSAEVADAVERDRAELARLVERNHTAAEMNLLKEFNGCWTDLRKIDKVLLGFAVENTNVKAFTLSFTKGREDMENFRKSLTSVIQRSGRDGGPLIQFAWDALAAASQVQSLHALHIATRSDVEMDKIETEIRRSNEIVKNSLRKMEEILPEGSRGELKDAAAAYADFEAVTARVVKLSRQNTNLKSFELSLGRKRKATARCDEILSSLQKNVQTRSYEATR